ncbi:MAG: hypothetical protein HYV42_01905 [Candidatus Magasanikbacteria bacterium]|nr:hypothetical protein [Candidatus Magasanikbacteria bacterium]
MPTLAEWRTLLNRLTQSYQQMLRSWRGLENERDRIIDQTIADIAREREAEQVNRIKQKISHL